MYSRRQLQFETFEYNWQSARVLCTYACKMTSACASVFRKQQLMRIIHVELKNPLINYLLRYI